MAPEIVNGDRRLALMYHVRAVSEVLICAAVLFVFILFIINQIGIGREGAVYFAQMVAIPFVICFLYLGIRSWQLGWMLICAISIAGSLFLSIAAWVVPHFLLAEDQVNLHEAEPSPHYLGPPKIERPSTSSP